MDREFLKEMREYSWNYFIAFAEARLYTFRFYLIFCTILIAGLAALLSANQKWLAISLSLLLSFLSFVYWKVDVRHKLLIKHAEKALEFLRDNFPYLKEKSSLTYYSCSTLKLNERKLIDASQNTSVPKHTSAIRPVLI